MERTSQPSVFERMFSRGRRERGATLVEYALVFSLIAVVSLGAVQYLQAQSEDEINNQADCVSDRPPPASCGYAPIPSDVTYPDPGYSPPTSAPPNAADVPTFTLGTGTEDMTSGWAVLMPVSLTKVVAADPPVPDEPVAGVRIRAEIRMEDPLNPPNYIPVVGYADCVTAADGTCTIRYDVPFDDVDIAKLRIIGIDTNPAPPVPTAVAIYDRNS